MKRSPQSTRKYPKDALTISVTVRLLLDENNLLEIISNEKGMYRSEYLRHLVQQVILKEGYSL